MKRYQAQDRDGWIVVQDMETGQIVEDGYENMKQARKAAKSFNEIN